MSAKAKKNARTMQMGGDNQKRNPGKMGGSGSKTSRKKAGYR